MRLIIAQLPLVLKQAIEVVQRTQFVHLKLWTNYLSSVLKEKKFFIEVSWKDGMNVSTMKRLFGKTVEWWIKNFCFMIFAWIGTNSASKRCLAMLNLMIFFKISASWQCRALKNWVKQHKSTWWKEAQIKSDVLESDMCIHDVLVHADQVGTVIAELKIDAHHYCTQVTMQTRNTGPLTSAWTDVLSTGMNSGEKHF